MKNFGRIAITLILLFTATAISYAATEYNYVSPEKMKMSMEDGVPMLIVDIQIKEEFSKSHITGSMATYAYPAKAEADTAKLQPVLAKYREDKKQIVIVCPRGKGGAKRSYDYLAAAGVDQKDLVILEKGMAGWPYASLTESL